MFEQKKLLESSVQKGFWVGKRGMFCGNESA